MVKTKQIINFIFTVIFELQIHVIICGRYLTEIENCKITFHGREYIGEIDVTKTGKTCIKWSKDLLNRLGIMETNFPDNDTILSKNVCRNPKNHPNGPWCIIDEKSLEWEYCNIPSCNKDNNWCKDTQAGEEYFGEINLTKTGKPCRQWITQNNFKGYLFPEFNLTEAENKCRNPDGYSNGPWCYTIDQNTRWETCSIPTCEKYLSQIEYFGGYDFLKTLDNQMSLIRLDDVYENVTFSVSFDYKLLNKDMQKKISFWATDYDPKCQTDLNEYEYCQMLKSFIENNEIIFIFNCLNPLKNMIFISPLEKSQYKFDYKLGNIYKIQRNPSEKFEQYQNKIKNVIEKRNRKVTSIPMSSNHGYFFILEDNVIPYASAPGNKPVFTISDVGKGRIGFAACEHYTNKDFLLKVEDFLYEIFGSKVENPKILTESILKELDSERKSGKPLTAALIWNSHNMIGHTLTKLLLELVKDGLKVVIGIKPWAYHYYKQNLPTSELRCLLIAAGIWPSMDAMSSDLKVINEVNIEAFPLVHLLDYATTSLTNAISVSEYITNILLNTPFDGLIDESNFTAIRKNIESLLPIHLHHIKSMIPCLDNPLSPKNDKSLIGFINVLLYQPLTNKFVAPGLSFYPGKIQSENVNTVTMKMKLNLKFNNEAAQLGLYVQPGEELNVKIIKSKSETCQLHFNYHLFNVINKAEWEKWPVVYSSIHLRRGHLKQISFSFGGLLSIMCKENNDNIELLLSGVVQVPMFDRRDSETNKNWKTLQKIKVPWAIIAGDSVVFVVSSNAIRNLAQPDIILELYDSMIKDEYHLRGKSIVNNRRELISTDIQIKAGYMHAGYPIGTMIYHVSNAAFISKYLFGKIDIKAEGRWGILHEVGHNLQENIFTFSGTTDVTNNVFTLVGIESVTGHSSWSPTEGWLSDESYIARFITYINNGNFTEWQNEPFLGLGVYAQLRANFGWELYAQVFREYDNLIKKYGSLSDHEEIQLWVKETSIYAGMNLCPLFDLWRWPIDSQTNIELSQYPFFLPNDFLTKLVPIRMNEIIEKYGGSVVMLREPLKIPQIVGNLINKLAIEGEKIIEEIVILK